MPHFRRTHYTQSTLPSKNCQKQISLLKAVSVINVRDIWKLKRAKQSQVFHDFMLNKHKSFCVGSFRIFFCCIFILIAYIFNLRMQNEPKLIFPITNDVNQKKMDYQSNYQNHFHWFSFYITNKSSFRHAIQKTLFLLQFPTYFS